jgi:predicted RNA methylase
MNFFDQYDRFYSTTRIGCHPNRLNSRYRAIIEPNLDLIRGRTILDIGSHDGRWSFAALMGGARHVTGVEGRAHLVDAARQTFAHYGVSDDRYRFFVGDAFEVLQRESIKVDTVLILGFFYHIYRHFEAAALAAATGASHIVLDTAVAKERGPGDAYIEYALEPTNKSGAALGPRAEELIGRPSRRAVELMFGQVGFELCDTDRSVNVGDPTRMEDYRDDRREIFILRRITATPDDSQIQTVASVQ